MLMCFTVRMVLDVFLMLMSAMGLRTVGMEVMNACVMISYIVLIKIMLIVFHGVNIAFIRDQHIATVQPQTLLIVLGFLSMTTRIGCYC